MTIQATPTAAHVRSPPTSASKLPQCQQLAKGQFLNWKFLFVPAFVGLSSTSYRFCIANFGVALVSMLPMHRVPSFAGTLQHDTRWMGCTCFARRKGSGKLKFVRNMWIWTCMAGPGGLPVRATAQGMQETNERIWWKIANEAHVTACTRMFADKQQKWKTTTSNRKKPCGLCTWQCDGTQGRGVCAHAAPTFLIAVFGSTFFDYFPFSLLSRWQMATTTTTMSHVSPNECIRHRSCTHAEAMQPSLFQIQFRISIFVPPYFAFPAAASIRLKLQQLHFHINARHELPAGSGWCTYCAYRVEMQGISEMLRCVKRDKNRGINVTFRIINWRMEKRTKSSTRYWPFEDRGVA